MGAKYYTCLLLVILLTSFVHCALLRRLQDAEKSPLFLFGRLFTGDDSLGKCCITCGKDPCASFGSPCKPSYCDNECGLHPNGTYTCCCAN